MALFTPEELATYLRNEIPTEDYPDLANVASSAESLVTKVSGRKWRSEEHTSELQSRG